MNESKISATDRLRKEGRWDEASRFRDNVRKKLRAKGISRQEASEQAWRETLRKFSPLPTTAADSPQSPADAAAVAELASRTAGSPQDLGRDIRWVYSHLLNDGIQAGDAPSGGAWSLLQWARKNQNLFFQHLLPRAAQASEADEHEEEMMRQEEKNLQKLRQFIVQTRKQFERERARRQSESGPGTVTNSP